MLMFLYHYPIYRLSRSLLSEHTQLFSPGSVFVYVLHCVSFYIFLRQSPNLIVILHE